MFLVFSAITHLEHILIDNLREIVWWSTKFCRIKLEFTDSSSILRLGTEYHRIEWKLTISVMYWLILSSLFNLQTNNIDIGWLLPCSFIEQILF